MFATLRKKSGSLIVYLMFAAIIITFVISFGPGDQGCRAQPNWVAMVGGEAITQSEFRFVYNNYYDIYQRMLPDFNAQKAKEMNISKAALDDLVNVMLLAQEAERLGFVVTDEEIRTEIIETPYFQQGGKFDRELYNRFVQVQMGMTISTYEEKVRRDLLARKLRTFLSDSADVSETELKEEYVNLNETVDAEFFVFSKDKMKPEAIQRLRETTTESDVNEFLGGEEKKVKSFYDSHKDRWAKEDKTVRPFEEVKGEIAREIMIGERIAALAKADAVKLRSLLSNPTYRHHNLRKDLPDWVLTPVTQTSIRKTQRYIPDIGISASLVELLFIAATAPGSLTEPVSIDDKVVVAKIIKHTPADMAKFESERATIRRSLHTMKAREIVENYIQALRAKTPLETNEHWLALFQKGGGDQ